MRKLILLTSFFFLTPLTLILSFTYLYFISYQKSSPILSLEKAPKVAYAALPNRNEAILLKTKDVDARVEAVEDFLSYYKSALTPFADEIVAAADKYSLDYRLLPAIAMQESTLCKKAPKGSHNCWGFGIYGKKVTKFANYNEAIETVTKTLATKYKAIGLETPEQIMSKYNPVSTGTWADGVSGYMDRLSFNL
ncbi:MAG: hypothetical protein UR81_C0022G0010 [Candidatus Levybacteria bacterium GW2011_GWB1_35_5]|nr:MAG: hypothetical protein UR81_C0022G0010 [Candidatus Levybacteria bacterium GW2011_GWB1_35_5]